MPVLTRSQTHAKSCYVRSDDNMRNFNVEITCHPMMTRSQSYNLFSQSKCGCKSHVGRNHVIRTRSLSCRVTRSLSHNHLYKHYTLA